MIFLIESFPIHTSEENVKDIENVIEVDSIHASEEKVSEKISTKVLIVASCSSSRPQFVCISLV